MASKLNIYNIEKNTLSIKASDNYFTLFWILTYSGVLTALPDQASDFVWWHYMFQVWQASKCRGQAAVAASVVDLNAEILWLPRNELVNWNTKTLLGYNNQYGYASVIQWMLHLCCLHLMSGRWVCLSVREILLSFTMTSSAKVMIGHWKWLPRLKNWQNKNIVWVDRPAWCAWCLP